MEFDREHVGTSIVCPTCGEDTLLILPKKRSLIVFMVRSAWTTFFKMETLLFLHLVALVGLVYVIHTSAFRAHLLVQHQLDSIDKKLGNIASEADNIASAIAPPMGGLSRRTGSFGRKSETMLDAFNEIDKSLDDLNKNLETADVVRRR
jgi:hypothetical protein